MLASKANRLQAPAKLKLIIQIPCFNEAGTLEQTLNDLPRALPGFEVVEWLVIDDGSTDDTSSVAEACGVHHIVRHTANSGLARAFMTGIEACLARGADVIVNTDADNQYRADFIPHLAAPILSGQADMVIGARPISEIEHFSPIKKALQRLGSMVVRLTSRTDIADAPSGFRAFSRAAAQHLTVFSKYTYTLETIIQAGHKNLRVVSVPIEVNGDLRPSRLVKSVPAYVRKSLFTIVRIFVVYQPARFFGAIAMALIAAGLALGLRFIYHFLTDGGSGHVQSLILCAVLLTTGFQTMLVAFLADLIAVNRRLLEDIRLTVRSRS